MSAVNFSPSHGPHTVHTAAPRQPASPLSWAQKFMSGMLRRRDGVNVQLPPIVEVPLTAGKPVRSFVLLQSLSMSHVDAEELSCKKEALSKLLSISETSYHAATKRRSDPKQSAIITATKCSHCIHDASRSYWYCRGSRYKS
jgi:hypothetical protein